jgi:hypothetical protein
MSTLTAAGLQTTAIIVSTTAVVILIFVLVVLPILYWIFLAVTGRLGR